MEIKFHNVSHTYTSLTSKKQALGRINLTIQEGKINGIIGSSGSGKTTLIEMINGLIIPTEGYIKVGRHRIEHGHKIENINQLRRHIGLVFQFPEDQFFADTVKEELMLGMKCFHYKEKSMDKHIVAALKMVELDESYLERNPFSLSNGEKRKVAIASILAYNPAILILDEPTIGLDTRGKNNLMKIIRTLMKRYRKTIIIVSHDVDMLHKLVDYVYVLNQGNLVLEGKKYDVFTKVEELHSYDLEVPRTILFSKKVLDTKGIKLGYRNELNDLIKDIYRYVK